MSTMQDKELPLSLPNHPLTIIGASIPKPPAKPPRPRYLICCGCAAALSVLVFVALIIIFLTVYRYRTPTITLSSFSLTHLGSPNGNPMLVADVTIKNPNIAIFRFSEFNTTVFYGDHLIGLGQKIQGGVPARRTVRFNMTVATGLLSGSAAGTTAIGLTSSTTVGGMVKIIGMIKHPVDLSVNCSITVSVVNQLVSDQSCVTTGLKHK